MPFPQTYLFPGVSGRWGFAFLIPQGFRVEEFLSLRSLEIPLVKINKNNPHLVKGNRGFQRPHWHP